MNQILKMLFMLWIAPAFGKFVGNSTQILTDMNTAINATPSATATANVNAAAGPIQDLPGMLQSIKLNFQEAQEKMAYLLQGSMIISTTNSPITAPTGGPITSAADSAIYNALVGIYQIIK